VAAIIVRVNTKGCLEMRLIICRFFSFKIVGLKIVGLEIIELKIFVSKSAGLWLSVFSSVELLKMDRDTSLRHPLDT
jgi:hypothetical protein